MIFSSNAEPTPNYIKIKTLIETAQRMIAYEIKQHGSWVDYLEPKEGCIRVDNKNNPFTINEVDFSKEPIADLYNKTLKIVQAEFEEAYDIEEEYHFFKEKYKQTLKQSQEETKSQILESITIRSLSFEELIDYFSKKEIPVSLKGKLEEIFQYFNPKDHSSFDYLKIIEKELTQFYETDDWEGISGFDLHEDITELLVRDLFKTLYFEKFETRFFSEKDSLDLFIQNFLMLPYEYNKNRGRIDSSKKMKRFYFVHTQKSLPIEAIHQNYADDIKIDLPVFMAYFRAMKIITGDSEAYFFEGHNHYSIGRYEIGSKNPTDVIIDIIKLRLQILSSNFKLALTNLKKSNAPFTKGNMKSKMLAKYLKQYYKDLSQNNNLKLHFLDGLQLPQEIVNILCEALVLIIEDEITKKDKKIYQAFLLPSDLDNHINPKTPNNAPLSEKQLQPFFSKKKIPWGKRQTDIELLEKAFSTLYLEKNTNNEPFVSQHDVIDLCKTNFDCYDNSFNPRLIFFNGSVKQLRHFCYQVYVKSEENGYKGKKKRYAQFLFQNFEIINELDETKTKFESHISQIKANEPKGEQAIWINKYIDN